MSQVRRRFVSTLFGAACGIFTLLSAASCYWNPETGSGELSLDLQSQTLLSQVDPGAIGFARVYIYTDNMNSRVDIGDGEPFAEEVFSAADRTITIRRVPAGTDYRLVLALGTKPDGETFVPGRYGLSDTFDVTARRRSFVRIGSVGQVSVFGGAGPGYDLLGRRLTGLAVSGGYVAASTEHILFAADSTTLASGLTAQTPVPGRSVLSLAGAYSPARTPVPQIWLNTTAGLLAWDTASRSIAAGQFAGGPSGPVLQSGIHTTASGAYAVYYQRAGGLGGILTPTSNTWVDIDLSGAVTGQPILDLALPASGTQYDFGFFASRVGAFAVSYQLLTDSQHDLSYIVDQAGFFRIRRGGRRLFARALALQSTTALLVGTNDGVYRLPVSGIVTNNVLQGAGDEVVFNDPPPTPAVSAGHPFRRVRYDQGTGLMAALSNHFLLIHDSRQSRTSLLPSAAVALGDVVEIEFFLFGNTTLLVIAGTEGLTYIPMG